MNVLRGIVKWIDAFESGSHFRKWTAILLKAMGILAIIGSVVLEQIQENQRIT